MTPRPAATRPEDRAGDAERLKQIEARARGATPGPWQRSKERLTLWDSEGRAFVASTSITHEGRDYERRNFEFIAHAREDIPFLVKRVRQLEAELDIERAQTATLLAGLRMRGLIDPLALEGGGSGE